MNKNTYSLFLKIYFNIIKYSDVSLFFYSTKINRLRLRLTGINICTKRSWKLLKIRENLRDILERERLSSLKKWIMQPVGPSIRPSRSRGGKGRREGMAIRSAFDSVEKIAFATFRRGDRIVCPYPRTRETKMYFRMCMPVNRVDYI